VGFPIRISTDQRLFAPSRSFSQRTTSFIASYRQGIHQMPLSHLIALISNAHPVLRPGKSLLKGLFRFRHSAWKSIEERPEFIKINPVPKPLHGGPSPSTSHTLQRAMLSGHVFNLHCCRPGRSRRISSSRCQEIRVA
jgi:hypothetical protein